MLELAGKSQGFANKLLRGLNVSFMHPRDFVLEFPKTPPHYMKPEEVYNEHYLAACKETWVQDDIYLFETLEYQMEEMNHIDHDLKEFSPYMLNELLDRLVRKDLAGAAFTIGTGIWGAMLRNPKFLSIIEPSTKKQDVQSGKLGRLLHLPVYTDSMRDPSLRAMHPHDVWVFPNPEFVGEIYTGPAERIKIEETAQTVNWTVQRRQRVRKVNTPSVARL